MPAPFRILLAAMPWAHHDRPSIQVGVLKAYLAAHGIEAEGAHWFLEVAHALGLRTYADLCQGILEDGEALYSYLLFPEMRRRVLRDRRLVRRAASVAADRKEKPPLKLELSERFFDRFRRLHREILDRYDWRGIALVGFTLNFGQTLASLYMAREIKKRNPGCRIVVGGAEASGQLGASLLRHFPQIDHACNGEGEKPLFALARALREGAPEEQIAALPGIASRAADGGVRVNPPEQVRTLRELPTPDFDAYFAAIAALGYESPHEVCQRIPIEASRGCYYACTFCALNLQWTGIRTQAPEPVAETLRALAARHRVLQFEFVDNVNPANARAIFDRVAADGIDYRFFFELRADVSLDVLTSMRRAGLSVAQIGIEALSTSLLKKWNKRTKVIHNLQAMKNCAALGIEVMANLIVGHPASTRDDLRETLRTMKLARGYPPPNAISRFALQVGAPDYETAAGAAIEILGNNERYRRIYPPRLWTTLDLPRKAFRSLRPQVDWRKVLEARDEWERSYAKTTNFLGDGVPHLACYDGGEFLRIEDFRSGELEVYVFEGLERDVYLAADQIVSWKTLRTRFAGVPEERLRRELAEMVGSGLVFEEDDCFLALAIGGRRSAPTRGVETAAAASI